jgi:hypothetical protein
MRIEIVPKVPKKSMAVLPVGALSDNYDQRPVVCPRANFACGKMSWLDIHRDLFSNRSQGSQSVRKIVVVN